MGCIGVDGSGIRLRDSEVKGVAGMTGVRSAGFSVGIDGANARRRFSLSFPLLSPLSSCSAIGF